MPQAALPLLFALTAEQYRTILDGVSAGILIYDRERIIRCANRRAVEYIGYDPTGETRDSYMRKITVTDPEGRPLAIDDRPLHLVWEGVPARDVPLMITNPEGQVFQVLITAIPLFQRGIFAGAVVIWNDVTLLERAILELKRREIALRQSEAALRESEERFRVALANASIFVYTMDRDLRYTWLYSPSTKTTLQWPIGKSNSDMIPPDSGLLELEALKRQAIDTGVGFRKEICVMVHDAPRVYDMTFEPLRDQAGNVIGLTGASMDITEQRHLEASQNEYAARIALYHRLTEQREQNLLHFAQKLHDGALQGMISLITDIQLVREVSASGEVGAVMVEIEARARDLADELKRVCSELNPPSATRFGLKRAIQAHTRDLHERYLGILFTVDLMEDILKLPEPTCLALYRIYREAVQNAIQHASAKTVSVRLSLDEHEIALEIRDDGAGFAFSDNWMEMIQNGQFGLVSMKEQADSIHGHLTLSSAPGAGTQVRLMVPLEA